MGFKIPQGLEEKALRKEEHLGTKKKGDDFVGGK